MENQEDSSSPQVNKLPLGRDPISHMPHMPKYAADRRLALANTRGRVFIPRKRRKAVNAATASAASAATSAVAAATAIAIDLAKDIDIATAAEAETKLLGAKRAAKAEKQDTAPAECGDSSKEFFGQFQENSDED